MLKDLNLDGLVLHSPGPRLELSRLFYQALLDVPFSLEQHGTSPQHYSSLIEHEQGKTILELCPSPAKMLSSFALSFSVPDVETVLKRMREHHYGPKAIHNNGKAVTFSDPEERNVRLNTVKNTTENKEVAGVRLQEVVLHTWNLSETCSFYEQLLKVPLVKQSYGAGQVTYYSATKNDLTLKLWQDNVYVAPSPSLLFTCPDLDQVQSQMSAYAQDWKRLSEKEARLLDPDKRKIFFYSN